MKYKMNILLITQYFWPENFRINDLAAGLVEQGHKITVLTGVPNYPEGKFFSVYGLFKNLRQDYRGIKIIRVPLVARGKGKKIGLILNYLSFAFFASILGLFLCRGKYHLIFVYEPSPITVGLPAIILKKFKSAPILFWVQDLWPESLSATGAVSSSMIIKIVKKIVNFIYHQCDIILVQSRAFIASIQSFGIDSKRIVCFPNSTEEFYRPIELSDDDEERKVIPSGFVVMFAGNIGAAQDFGTIIDAAEKLKSYQDIYWVILGDGRMCSWAKDRVVARGLQANFLFLGRYPAEAMPRYFSLADALLVTLKDDEIFKQTIPSKVQSYLACAKPIIAGLAGEGAKIIEESGAGLTCSPEDSDALAKNVLEMYHMEESKRLNMGIKGREYFKDNFEREKLLDQLDRIFKSINGEKV